MKERHVAVIGAGVGGLSAAIRLAARGCRVTVCEAADAPGGKLGRVALGGAVVDSGPALLTLRPVFEELFAAAGTALEARLALRPMTHLGRNVWPDGSVLDLGADEARNAEAIGDFAGAAAARGYRGFMQRARDLRAALAAAFLRAARPTALSLTAELGLARLLGLSPFALLGEALGKHFADPRLRQLFGGYGAYVGAAPGQAPATLMMVAAIEQEGLWRIEGGCWRLADALADAARGMGVALRLGCPVAEVRVAGGRAAGVVLADGEVIAADAVIANADVAALGAGLLGAAAARAAEPVAPRRRSLSAVTWAMRGRLKGRAAPFTSVVFPDPAADEYTAMALRGAWPAASTLHLFALERGAEPVAGVAAEESLLLSMSAPARGETPEPPDLRGRLTRTRLDALARAGFEVTAAPDCVAMTTPADWARRFPGTGGALYGPAIHGWNAAFERPRAATRLPGLFLAGGGTHPGSGLGMAAMSGGFAAAAALQETS